MLKVNNFKALLDELNIFVDDTHLQKKHVEQMNLLNEIKAKFEDPTLNNISIAYHRVKASKYPLEVLDGNYSIYHFLLDYINLYQKYLLPFIPQDIEVNKAQKLAMREQIQKKQRIAHNTYAILLRAQRFQLKWLTLYGLTEEHPHIKAKFAELDTAMLSITVNLQIDRNAKQPQIILSTIVATLVKHLTVFENQLKKLMPLLTVAHLQYPANSFVMGAKTRQFLQMVAPVKKNTQQKVEDYYYVCRFLLLDPQSIHFSDQQRIQWLSYFNEFKDLFLLYEVLGSKCDVFLLQDQNYTMNLSFSEFYMQTSYSKNTFSRFINATHRTMLQAWLVLFFGLLAYIKSKRVKK